MIGGPVVGRENSEGERTGWGREAATRIRGHKLEDRGAGEKNKRLVSPAWELGGRREKQPARRGGKDRKCANSMPVHGGDGDTERTVSKHQ